MFVSGWLFGWRLYGSNIRGRGNHERFKFPALASLPGRKKRQKLIAASHEGGREVGWEVLRSCRVRMGQLQNITYSELVSEPWT